MSTSLFIDKLYADFNSKSPHENIFFSPYCISLTLPILLLGSEGETQKQIFNSGGLMKKPPAVDTKTDSSEVIYSSNLFLESSLDVNSEYVNAIKRLGCTVYNLSYLTDSDRKKSVKYVNELVSEQTRNRIKQILNHESLNVFTKAIISSVIYFEAKWSQKFYRLHTSLKDFYNSDGTKTQVSMMEQTGDKYFSYDEDLKVKCVGKFYENSLYIMWFFLPDEGFKLTKDLTVDKMLSIIDKSEEKLVHLSVPRFKIEYEKHLKETFNLLGMTDMFDIKKADFSKISDEPEIHVSDIFHKAFLEVYEDGTIAGAVTRK